MKEISEGITKLQESQKNSFTFYDYDGHHTLSTNINSDGVEARDN